MTDSRPLSIDAFSPRVVRATARALMALVPLAPIAIASAQGKPGDVVRTADHGQPAEDLVVAAEKTLQNVLREHQQAASLRENLGRARAVLIFPSVVRVSFVGGFSGGKAVLVLRSGDEWKGPLFYDVDIASVGIQIGLAVSEMVMLVMTDKGVEPLLQDSANVSRHQRLGIMIGVGTISSNAPSADGGAASENAPATLAFILPTGFYAGFSVDDTKIRMSKTLNESYYGRPMEPPDILAAGAPPKSGALIRAVASAASVK